MPTLKIDEKEVTVPEGTTIIEAAKRCGISIPHYCYHPGLSIAGNCRICFVELENNPKLQISCYTPVAEGMVVRTRTEKVRKARQAVLEFLLINHPLDCPVCDQSGECKLQDYYMEHGLYDSRFCENKVKKPKVVRAGPHVMLDAERCIQCSRCVRFCREITKTHELGIVNRGDRSEITVIPGKELDNPYSANVVDICPVGALTDRDFRFKCRVWFLAQTPSVCPGCSQGCNIEIHWNEKRPYQTPGERVMRIKPRVNAEVNQWWICDEGRYQYRFIDQNRILKPLRKEGDSFSEISWDEALSQMAPVLSRPQEIGVMVSTDLTNEDLWMAREVFLNRLNVRAMAYQSLKKAGYQDDFLIKADKSPNTEGARSVGLEGKTQELLNLVLDGSIQTLFLFGHDLAALFGNEIVEKIKKKVATIIFIGSNTHDGMSLAHWVLPSSVYAEKEGTFTNAQGRVQRLFKAFPPLGESKPEWEIIQGLSQRVWSRLDFKNAEEIFEEMSRSVKSFKGMSYEKIGETGMIHGD